MDACPTERAGGCALAKGAGFPAGDALREMRLQRVLANTTYFRHYPNPTHNPIVEQLCAHLDAVGMSGNFLTGKDPLKHFSSGETFLPRSKRNVDAHYAKPLAEVIEEQLDALLADASFAPQQREEAVAIAAAMEDELLFYDELRAQAKRQAEIGDNTFMLRAFRRLVPIWVAKQDCCKVWQRFRAIAVPARSRWRLTPRSRRTCSAAAFSTRNAGGAAVRARRGAKARAKRRWRPSPSMRLSTRLCATTRASKPCAANVSGR